MQTVTAEPATNSSRLQAIFDAQTARAPHLATTTAGERKKKLVRIADYLAQPENEQRLFEALAKDFRKPALEIATSEIGVVQVHINHIKRHLRDWMRPERIPGHLGAFGLRSYIHYEPKGRVLVLSPWNYPFLLAVSPVLHAIAAGCTVVLKPSEISAHTTAYLQRMFGELFPEEEVAVVAGDAAVAQQLTALPFDHIFFTGSPAVGKKVMAAAADNLTSVTLELGGKSPTVMDDSVNVAKQARHLLWAKCFNAGQTCIAPDYVLAHESIADELVRELGKAIPEFYGGRVQDSPDFARIISDKHFQHLADLLADAKAKGAQVHHAVEPDAADRFFPPTVLTGVTNEMRVMQEEIFGPILPVLHYRNTDEVVATIRNRPKPLALYIISHRRRLVDYLLRHTSAGGTMVNDYLLNFANPHLPFGGVNNSGMGRSVGYRGFLEFSNERSVMERRWGNIHIAHPPYRQGLARWANKLFRWL
jgi:aldehyde dehydrogenase (NAD+)